MPTTFTKTARDAATGAASLANHATKLDNDVSAVEIFLKIQKQIEENWHSAL